MRISALASVALACLLGTAGMAFGQTYHPKFAPGQLIVGFKSPADADTAMDELQGGNATQRGLPGALAQVTKLGDTMLVVRLPDAPASVRGDPDAELAWLEDTAEAFKKDPRVEFASPNWMKSISPPPGPPRDAAVVPQSFEPNSGQAAPAPRGFVIDRDGPDQRRPGSPSDRLYRLQWSLLPPPRGMNAIGAWEWTHGDPSIVVAVLDTGIVPDQEDIRASGHVLPGYNFVTSSSCKDEPKAGPGATDPGNEREGCKPSDAPAGWTPHPNWHGTHVAGIIGAVGSNNRLGIVGMAWNVTILPVRVLTFGGGFDDDILKAMKWAAGLHQDGVPDNPHPADILNLSLGGAVTAAHSNGMPALCADSPNPYSKAIQEVRKAGAVVVVSAGNGETIRNDGKLCNAGTPGCERRQVDMKMVWPAGCPGVISVAASDMHGRLAPYSNFGAVTVMAPGGDMDEGSVTRTKPDGSTEYIDGAIVFSDGKVWQAHAPYGGILSAINDGYSWKQGTSQAAPEVSGAIALFLSAHPEFRHLPDAIEQAVREATIPQPAGGCPVGKTCGRACSTLSS